MKNKKHTFTKDQEIELGLLRAFFDVLLEQAMPKVAELVQTDKELTQQEVAYMQKGLNTFDNFIFNSKFKNDYYRMVDLIELEEKYNKQKFIEQMLDNECYEVLNTMKKMGHLKSF